MVDSPWDSPAPPPKKGLSVLGKVFIGCGAALLCFLLAVGALAWVVTKKVNRDLDRGWARVQQEFRALSTEEGVRALYRKNPGLAQTYATEEEFVKASAAWRSGLGSLPEKRPGLVELFKGGGKGVYSIHSRSDDNGRTSFTLRTRLSTGATLVLEWENDKLTDIQVEQ